MKPKVLVLRAAGTNCDVETATAFSLVGAEPTTLHVNRLREQPLALRDYQFLAIPGGFSYGDDIASGRIFANELMSVLRDEMLRFVERGGYIIGICNGFQVLVKAGLLPRLGGEVGQQATLTHNTSGRYEDRWVRLQPHAGRCAWLNDDTPFELPCAHGEGRFTASPGVIERLQAEGQIALSYTEGSNHNGSISNIAGICDPSGRVLGLMPHPERFLRFENHPAWTRLPKRREGDGIRLFRAAVRHAKGT